MKISRNELKKSARRALRKSYVMALIMSIIICVAGGVMYQINPNQNERMNQVGEYYNPESAENYFEPLAPAEAAVAMLNLTGLLNSVISVVLSFFSFPLRKGAVKVLFFTSVLFRLFIGYSLEIGARGWFIDTAQGRQAGFSPLKIGFGAFYKNVGFTMFLRSLYVFLWTMLFFIPGVIKSYSYIFVPYILADNSGISSKRVLELSKQMTKGYKFKIFILGLSFIGWQFLGILFMLVGQALVWPYINATFAELYLKLRENAIEKGFTTFEELGIDEEPAAVAEAS